MRIKWDGVNPKPSGGLLEYGTIVDEFVKENGDMKVQPKYVSYKEFSNLIEGEKEKARSLNEDLRTDVSNTIKEIAMSKTRSHKEYVISDIESTKELSNFIYSEKEKAKMQYEKIAGSYSNRAKIIKDDVLFPNIEKVHFNGPCTVVIWDDGTKTVVRCQDGDEFDCEKGLAMAIAKKALGNKGSYFDEFKKWMPKTEYSGFEALDESGIEECDKTAAELPYTENKSDDEKEISTQAKLTVDACINFTKEVMECNLVESDFVEKEILPNIDETIDDAKVAEYLRKRLNVFDKE